METPEETPEDARARNTDPGTSHEAAASVKKETQRAAYTLILQLFVKFKMLTDQEIRSAWTRYGFPEISDSGLRTRRHELVTRGDLMDSGYRRELESGRLAIVWQGKE